MGAPAKSDSAPRRLTPALDLIDAGQMPSNGWFLNLGQYPDAVAATAGWQALRAKHLAALRGLGKLAGSGDGPEPLLVGPLGDEVTAHKLCGQLGQDAHDCQPIQL